MKTLVNISLVLVVLLVSVSAYIRLAHSGIGCADWPECYGRLGPVDAVPGGEPAATVPAIIRSIHRVVASSLALIVIALAVTAVLKRRHVIPSIALLVLTVFLAALGVRSGGLQEPMIIMGNLAGGFVMLGLLGWLAFRNRDAPPTDAGGRGLRRVLQAALVVLAVQILLGGLTSANFAATACPGLPDCRGQWWPDESLATALDLGRVLALDSQGKVMAGAAQISIHLLHRIMALVSLLILLAAGVLAMRLGGAHRTGGLVLVLLVITEFIVGAAAVVTALPISLAVLHNWLAALLVLSILHLVSLNHRHSAGESQH